MKDVETTLENLKIEMMQAGIEHADRLEVSNPYGPTGLHLIERDPSNGGVNGNTSVGSYYWTGPKQAQRELMAIWRGMRAARVAVASRG